MSEQLNPLSAPLPAGPYSTAVRLKNGFLFLSGQLPLDLATGEISGTTVEEQAGMILKNIRNILKD
jgi:2-iminobutanoate/2-iminopropanoate deaminase